MSTQRVPRTEASSAKGKSAPARVAALTKVTLEARSRWVSEMPAYAAAPSGEGTPGTTSNGTPAAARLSASSDPRPKRKGSPPLSRTTLRPARASSTSAASIAPWLACLDPASPPRLPTQRTSAPARA